MTTEQKRAAFEAEIEVAQGKLLRAFQVMANEMGKLAEVVVSARKQFAEFAEAWEKAKERLKEND